MSIWLVFGTVQEVEKRKTTRTTVQKEGDWIDRLRVRAIRRDGLVLGSLDDLSRKTGMPISWFFTDGWLDVYNEIEKQIGTFPIIVLNE